MTQSPESGCGTRRTVLRRLARDGRGAALTEFGLISPVLFLLLFGAFDVGHTLYMQSVIQGSLQKAARDGTLEAAAGNVDDPRDLIDSLVRAQIQPLHKSATITFDRRFYRTFTDAAAAKAETIIGDDGNGVCDSGESFMDANHNGVWDSDGGDSIDRAGARDNVVYTVKVEYKRLFPLYKFIGKSDTNTLTATTVLANQPFGDQDKDDPPVAVECP